MCATMSRSRSLRAIVAFYVCASQVSFADILFTQTNLVSDIPGLAANTDAHLVNPWGVSFSPTSPFWVSDQRTNVSTLYNAAGVPQGGPLVVSTPGGPTGQVFNATLLTSTPGFLIGATPSTFIFATLSGNIEAWNGAQGTTAAIMHSTAGAVYTGLTMANNQLYAANKATGKIDVFNSSFSPVSLGAAAFSDAAVPAGMTPYNIQVVNGNLWVEYSGPRGSPGGFVAEFDVNGNLMRNLSDPHLNAPWGIVMAPAGFGSFGGDLLIGNFLDGMINAFDPSSGAFVGTLKNNSGNPIANPGLWSLEFRTPVAGNANTGNDPDALFFTAGINNENDGLFGRIAPVPEPGSIELLGLVLLTGLAPRLWRRLRA